MLRLHFPNGSLILHYRASLTPVRTLQCLASEDEVRRLLVNALSSKTALNALRNFFAQWNSEAKRVNVIDDRKLIERVARMTVNGPLAAFVVYDRHATHSGDVEARLTAQRDGATQQSNAPGATRTSVAGKPATGTPAPVRPPTASGAPAATGAPAAVGPNANPGVSENAAMDVSHLIAEQRIEQMLRRSANYMPQLMRATFVKVYERDMLFITVAVMTVWARYRDVSIGGILDALLLDATHLGTGQSIVTAARKLHKAIETTVDAREEKDFEVAARLFAEVLEEIGLPHFRSAIRHGADRIIQSAMKSKPPARPPPTPPRLPRGDAPRPAPPPPPPPPAPRGGIEWQKQPGATDADLAKAKKMWEDAKKRRLPDGSKPDTVKAMEALETSDKKTVIQVGAEGNDETPNNEADGMTPGKGTGSTIRFNPDKKGAMSDGTERDPESSLAHEAVHSYQDTQGTTPATREQQEVSAAAAENQHRKAKGLPQRQKYGGVWDIPQA